MHSLSLCKFISRFVDGRWAVRFFPVYFDSLREKCSSYREGLSLSLFQIILSYIKKIKLGEAKKILGPKSAHSSDIEQMRDAYVSCSLHVLPYFAGFGQRF